VLNVTQSLIEAHSTSGRITYDGDPGMSGEYKLTSHSGDLDVSIPAGQWCRSMHIHSQVLVIRLQLQVQPRESAKALGSSSPGQREVGRVLCYGPFGARSTSSGLDWIADARSVKSTR
jgi:hypothetical protein